MMLLHGTPGSPGEWIEGEQADVTTDSYARAHEGVAPIVVMPVWTRTHREALPWMAGRMGLVSARPRCPR